MIKPQTFFNKFSPAAAGSNVSVILVNGGLNNQSVPGTEVHSPHRMRKLLLNDAYLGKSGLPIHNLYAKHAEFYSLFDTSS